MSTTATTPRPVGRIITETLSAFGINSTPDCPCRSIANAMDKDGPDKVEEKLEHYAQKMAESAAQWAGVSEKFSFAMSPCKSLIRYAIRTARKEAARANQD